MNTLLAIDLETTGTDRSKDVVIEVGAALWSVTHRSLVCAYSTIVRAEANPAAAVNGIPEPLLVSGRDVAEAWKVVGSWVARADAIIGHNVEGFDRHFVPMGWDQGKPWIDSMTDLAPWPRPTDSQSLMAIALAHGVGVSHAHRALTDVLLLIRLLERVAEMADLNAMLVRALRPKALFEVTEKGYDPARNELAKAAGFRWVPERKAWERRLAKEDAGALPFAVREVAA